MQDELGIPGAKAVKDRVEGIIVAQVVALDHPGPATRRLSGASPGWSMDDPVRIVSVQIKPVVLDDAVQLRLQICCGLRHGEVKVDPDEPFRVILEHLALLPEAHWCSGIPDRAGVAIPPALGFEVQSKEQPLAVGVLDERPKASRKTGLVGNQPVAIPRNPCGPVEDEDLKTCGGGNVDALQDVFLVEGLAWVVTDRPIAGHKVLAAKRVPGIASRCNAAPDVIVHGLHRGVQVAGHMA